MAGEGYQYRSFLITVPATGTLRMALSSSRPVAVVDRLREDQRVRKARPGFCNPASLLRIQVLISILQDFIPPDLYVFLKNLWFSKDRQRPSASQISVTSTQSNIYFHHRYWHGSCTLIPRQDLFSSGYCKALTGNSQRVQERRGARSNKT